MLRTVKFVTGTKSKYEEAKRNEKLDNDTIYFITDEVTHTNRLYVGQDCFNVEITDSLDNVSSTTVLASSTTKEMINNKVNRCKIINDDSAELPDTLLLENDTEYRYLNLSGAESLKISINIPNNNHLFYSSVILSQVNSEDSVADFVVVDEDSEITEVMFLNKDIYVSGNTAELLFFSNGLNICCIVATYDSNNT